MGHKTSGDWTDVTSYTRNEIVFEGRNKEYGAYFVRQRYNEALLLSLLIATSIGVICAGIPFVMNFLNKGKVVEKTTTDVNIHPQVYVEHFHKVIIPPTPPAPPRPPVRASNHFTPVVTTHDPIEQIIPEQRDNPPVNPNPTGGTPGDGPINPVGGAGTGINPVVPVAPPEPPTVVQIMPAFNGSLEGYINNKLIYPDFEKSQDIQGIVYVTFIVEADGSISGVKLLRGISNGPGLNDEALKVIENMPKWSPGMQNGYAVRVRLNLPIHFAIQGEQ